MRKASLIAAVEASRQNFPSRPVPTLHWPERQSSRKEEYPFGLLRTARRVWTREGAVAVAPTIMGNKEKQNKIAYCAACFVNNLLRFLSLSLSLSRRWSQTFYALRLRARAQRNIRQRNCNDAEWKSESKKTATEINKCISQLRVLRLTGWRLAGSRGLLLHCSIVRSLGRMADTDKDKDADGQTGARGAAATCQGVLTFFRPLVCLSVRPLLCCPTFQDSKSVGGSNRRHSRRERRQVSHSRSVGHSLGA